MIQIRHHRQRDCISDCKGNRMTVAIRLGHRRRYLQVGTKTPKSRSIKARETTNDRTAF